MSHQVRLLFSYRHPSVSQASAIKSEECLRRNHPQAFSWLLSQPSLIQKLSAWRRLHDFATRSFLTLRPAAVFYFWLLSVS